MKSAAKPSAMNETMRRKMINPRYFLGMLLFVFALTGGCKTASQTPSTGIQIVGSWKVLSMKFPDHPAGQAVQKQSDAILPSLRYVFGADSSYTIITEKRPDGVPGRWRNGPDPDSFIVQSGDEVANLLRCSSDSTSCPDCIRCTTYNPEIGAITFEIQRIKP